MSKVTNNNKSNKEQSIKDFNNKFPDMVNNNTGVIDNIYKSNNKLDVTISSDIREKNKYVNKYVPVNRKEKIVGPIIDKSKNNITNSKYIYNYDAIEKFCRIGPSTEELAAVLGISHETVCRALKDDNEFMRAYKNGVAQGKTSLRRRQMQTAMTDVQGSYLMQIWLGKQYLSQADKKVSETNISVDMKNQVQSWFLKDHPQEAIDVTPDPQDVVDESDDKK